MLLFLSILQDRADCNTICPALLLKPNNFGKVNVNKGSNETVPVMVDMHVHLRFSQNKAIGQLSEYVSSLTLAFVE